MEKLYKHHIIPRHSGSTDDLSNIKLVTLSEHAEEHRLLWEKNKNQYDYIAWKCLCGQIPVEEAINKIRSINGKKQGEKNAQSGWMLKIRLLMNPKETGKKSAEFCRKNKINSFFDPEILKEVRKKGGHVQGKKNAESGHLQRISKLPRKYTKKQWYYNENSSILIKDGDPIPDGYIKGRKCPHKNN